LDGSVALIDTFFADHRDCQRHRTSVECGWQVVRDDRGRLLQLATFGSDDRASGKKVSQTVQLDEQAARDLLRILNEFFRVS
jgi:hypothetical protein